MSLFVAEVKTESPFGYRSEHTWNYLFEQASRFGDMLSIHTDPRWGGSFDLLAQARRRTEKPILAKGIHDTDEAVIRALNAGADRVLVVGRLPSEKLMPKVWFEPKEISELASCPLGTKVVWNARDLQTGQPKTSTVYMARAKWSGWLCQASHIKKPDDVAETMQFGKGVQAFIVGENLLKFIEART